MVEIQFLHGLYHLKSCGIVNLAQDQVVDKEITDSEAVGYKIAQLAQRIGIKSNQAATAVSGSAVITRIIDMDAELSDSEREAEIRLDADQYIPFALSDVNLDFEVLGPLQSDMSMVRVLLAASRTENIEQRVDALAFGGFETKVVDIEAHAIERAFDFYVDSLPGLPQMVALIDIGHTQTTLYMVKDGELVYSREQLYGGAQLTEGIQNHYALTFEEATVHKQTYSLPDDYNHDVLLPFLESLVQHISRALQFYFTSNQYGNVDHVVLCGGSASLSGLSAMVEKQLQIATSIANPFVNMCIDSSIDKQKLAQTAPAFMAACGLALRSAA